MNDPATQYILFYSPRCQHSKRVLKQMDEGGLNSKFQRVNVDNAEHIPQFVTHVPTILVDKNRKIQGTEVVEWLSKMTEQTEVMPIGDSMTDPYSFIDQPQAIHQSFSYLSDIDSSISQGNNSSQSIDNGQARKTSNMDKDERMEQLLQARANDAGIPQPVKRV